MYCKKLSEFVTFNYLNQTQLDLGDIINNNFFKTENYDIVQYRRLRVLVFGYNGLSTFDILKYMMLNVDQIELFEAGYLDSLILFLKYFGINYGVATGTCVPGFRLNLTKAENVKYSQLEAIYNLIDSKKACKNIQIDLRGVYLGVELSGIITKIESTGVNVLYRIG